MGRPIRGAAIRSGFLAAAGITLIAFLDFSSGTEFRTFPLYYAPISVVAWHFGRTGAVSAALVCALAWLASNQLAGLEYSHSIVWVANTLVQGASFTVVGLLVANLKLAVDRERALSRTDPLCSVLNSRAFYEDGGRLLAVCRSNGEAATLAFLDLDNFKLVNDSLGHEAGDDLLCRVAEILTSSVGRGDLAARLGGDEFAVLLPGLGLDDARRTLERMRIALAGPLAAVSPTVSASIGAVTFLAAPGDIQVMIQAADALMYSAKRHGKNRLQLDVVGEALPLGREDLTTAQREE